MNSKAIRKQLLAAVAMVLVAAVALGSSTYAWFASNNKVSAELSSIKATSDAAFLEISSTKEGETVTWSNLTSVSITSATNPLDLLPSRVKSVTTGTPTFETAHALAPTASTINTESLKDVSVGDFGKYVWKTTVYVRAQSGTYTNLTMDNLSITATSDTAADLVGAGRILAVCGENYQLRSKTGTETLTGNATYLYTGDLTGETYATVDLYFFYDGDTSTVYTNNIEKLGAISATVGFVATQK